MHPYTLIYRNPGLLLISCRMHHCLILPLLTLVCILLRPTYSCIFSFFYTCVDLPSRSLKAWIVLLKVTNYLYLGLYLCLFVYMHSAALFDVDYLESLKMKNNPESGTLSRESIYIKFDPLVSEMSRKASNACTIVPCSAPDERLIIVVSDRCTYLLALL